MERDVKNLRFFQGMPSKEDLESWSIDRQHSVLIIDDLMSKCAESQDICDLFTIFSHHMNFTVFLLVQNLFANGKQFRTISLNTHHFILFDNKRDLLQIKTFARECFPEQTKFFMESYLKAVSTKFGYLFVDLSPRLSAEENLYRLRTNIFPGETTIVYLPCDKKILKEAYFIGLLFSADKSQRHVLIQTISKRQLAALIEIVYNILHGYRSLSERDKKNLQKYQYVIRKFVHPRISATLRKQLLHKQLYFNIFYRLLKGFVKGLVIQWAGE